MRQKLDSEEEINDFLRSYNPATDPRLVFRFEKNKAFVIDPEDYIKFDGRWCKYLGFVKNPESVENITCFYRLGRGLYYRKQKLVDLSTAYPSGRRTPRIPRRQPVCDPAPFPRDRNDHSETEIRMLRRGNVQRQAPERIQIESLRRHLPHGPQYHKRNAQDDRFRHRSE